MITINAKYYKRLSKCWKRKDSPFIKKDKILQEIHEIEIQNCRYPKSEIIDVIIADFKGQVSNNNFLQIISIIFSVIIAFIGILTGASYIAWVGLAFIVVILVIMLYCLRYFYAEGFTIQVLEDYKRQLEETESKLGKSSKEYVVTVKLKD